MVLHFDCLITALSCCGFIFRRLAPVAGNSSRANFRDLAGVITFAPTYKYKIGGDLGMALAV